MDGANELWETGLCEHARGIRFSIWEELDERGEKRDSGGHDFPPHFTVTPPFPFCIFTSPERIPTFSPQRLPHSHVGPL